VGRGGRGGAVGGGGGGVIRRAVGHRPDVGVCSYLPACLSEGAGACGRADAGGRHQLLEAFAHVAHEGAEVVARVEGVDEGLHIVHLGLAFYHCAGAGGVGEEEKEKHR
jgi:hypothetical protein